MKCVICQKSGANRVMLPLHKKKDCFKAFLHVLGYGMICHMVMGSKPKKVKK